MVLVPKRRLAARHVLPAGLLILACVPAAATNVSGTLTANATWSPAGNPYVMTADVTVSRGVTLTIQPGTIVQSSGPSLFVEGVLNVGAPSGANVLFTSGKATKNRGDWGGIAVQNRGTATIDTATIEYATASVSGYGTAGALILYNQGTVNVVRTTFQHLASRAIYSWTSGGPNTATFDQNSVTDSDNGQSNFAVIDLRNTVSATVTRCNVSNIKGWGIYGGPTTLIQNNTVTGCTVYPVSIPAEMLHVTGPNTLTGNTVNAYEVRGGNIVSDVTPDNDLAVTDNVDVLPLVTITLSPGRNVLFGTGISLFVDGALNAPGTGASRIRFGPLAANPQRGAWGGIAVENLGTATMSYCTVDYPGGNISGYGSYGGLLLFAKSALTASNVTIQHSAANGLTVWDNNPPNDVSFTNGTVTDCLGDGILAHNVNTFTFTGNTVSACTGNVSQTLGAPVRTRMGVIPTISGNTFSGNKTNMVVVDASNSGTNNWTLTNGTLGQDTLFRSDSKIGPGTTFSIPQGRTLKFDNCSFYVDGTLNALGGAAAGQGILFTSNQAVQAPGGWGALVLEAGVANLANVTVDYAGGSASGYGSFGGIIVFQGSTLNANLTTVRNSAANGVCVWDSNLPVAVTFTNGTIQQCAGDGVRALNVTSLNVTGNTIKNCTGTLSNSQGVPVRIQASSINGVSGNTFTSNKTNLLELDGGTLTTAATSFHDCRVAQNVKVDIGGSLIMPAGRTWKFDQNTILYVDGSLTANGTAASPVLFTANQTVATRGSWMQIAFENGGVGNLTSAIVENGGGNGAPGLVTIYNNANLKLTGCTLQKSASRAFYAYPGGKAPTLTVAPGATPSIVTDCVGDGMDFVNAGSVSITGTTISACSGNPLRGQMPDVPGVSGNTLTGNGEDLFRIDGGTLTTSGASGQDTHIMGNVVVDTDTTLTMPPGRTWTFSGTRMDVNGTLNAIGTPASPITFTSNSASPTAGEWRGLYFQDLSQGNLAYVNVSYGGAQDGSNLGIVDRATLVADHVTVSNSSSRGFNLYNSRGNLTWTNGTITTCAQSGMELHYDMRQVTVKNSTFTNNGTYPLIVQPNQLQGLSGNTFSGNHPDQMEILPGTQAANATIDVNAFVSGNLYIPIGVTLNVAAGRTMTFLNDHLEINGQLVANGGNDAASRITFTSSKDTPVAGDWGGLQVNAGGVMTLSSCDVLFGGSSGVLAALVYVNGGQANLQYTKLSDSPTAGLYANGIGTFTLSGCTIQNTDRGVDLEQTSFGSIGGPGLQCNNIMNNTTYGVLNNTTTLVNATGNWWGAASGPLHTTLNPTGTGNKVSDKVAFQPFLTSPCVPVIQALPGDINNDGVVDMKDVQAALAIAAGRTTADSGMVTRGDVSPKPGTGGRTYGDGKITAMDAVRILRKLGSLEPAFP